MRTTRSVHWALTRSLTSTPWSSRNATAKAPAICWITQGRGQVNQKGLDYYSRLVDALLEKNITPFITMFHWDMPQVLFEKYGGFAGRETSGYFADYAGVIVKALGDRVKHWITLNEPWEHAFFGHFTGEHAPGITNPWTYFKVAHHELLGHGLAVECVRALAPDAQVGITLSQFPVYPYADTPRHQDAARFADLFMNRFYLDGLYRGQYPEELTRYVWAALDCPSGWAYLHPGGRVAVLGQFAAHIEMPVPVEGDLVVIGWPIIDLADDPSAGLGRKHRCGSALFDAEGRPLAWAVATWFDVDPGKFAP